MFYETNILANNIRIIHVPTKSKVAHLGVMINTGSRDESRAEHGLAHFIEHVMFKGTTKRKAYHILTKMENVGGDMNAFTSKEETCIYSTFLKQDYSRAIELLYDICFNSTFPEKELEKEKEVVIEEINSYKDNPTESIFDDFEELVFYQHPLGKNILGTEENVRSFSKNNILKFMIKNYDLASLVITSVGDISFNELVKKTNKYFGQALTLSGEINRQEFLNDKYSPLQKAVKKNFYQTHLITGNLAYHIHHGKKTGLTLLNNILGGASSNSRLNMTLREKYSLTYSVESSYIPYSDTGIFSIYFSTEKKNIEKAMELVKKELKKMREDKLGVLQLNRAKRQIKGQITIASEMKENQMINFGRSYLLFNKVDSLEEIYKKIDKVTSVELLDIANEVLNIDLFSTLVYK